MRFNSFSIFIKHFENTNSSKCWGEHSKNGSHIATAALFTKASKCPKESTTVLVLSQSAISTSTISIEGYSRWRLSKWDLVLDNATIFAPDRHNSMAIPLPMPITKKTLM